GPLSLPRGRVVHLDPESSSLWGTGAFSRIEAGKVEAPTGGPTPEGGAPSPQEDAEMVHEVSTEHPGGPSEGRAALLSARKEQKSGRFESGGAQEDEGCRRTHLSAMTRVDPSHARDPSR